VAILDIIEKMSAAVLSGFSPALHVGNAAQAAFAVS
jgi:predicted O-methyltransferase YrrM